VAVVEQEDRQQVLVQVDQVVEEMELVDLLRMEQQTLAVVEVEVEPLPMIVHLLLQQ
jgi:hypothetical protein